MNIVLYFRRTYSGTDILAMISIVDGDTIDGFAGLE